MTEIAAVIAVIVALAALWLSNHAVTRVDATFEDFTLRLAKQVKEAQSEMIARADGVRNELRALERSVESLEQRGLDHGEKLHTLAQRVAVLEHDLKSLSDAIPPQFRRVPPKRDINSA